MLVDVSKGMRAVKLCSNKILQFLTGGAGPNDRRTVVVVVVVVVTMHLSRTISEISLIYANFNGLRDPKHAPFHYA